MGTITEEVVDIELHMPKFSVDSTFPGVPHPLPNKSFFALYCGPPSCGKTSLMTSFLLTKSPKKIYNGVFEHVYLFVPEVSFRSMTDNPFRALSEDKINFIFNTNTLNTVLRKVEESAKKNHNSLIIIDDFAANLKDVELRRDVERMVNNRRHKRLSVKIISQTYRALPMSVRKILTHVFMFKVNNIREIESLREELIPRDRNEFLRIYNHIFPPSSDSHVFMYLDLSSGTIYNRFSKIIIS